MLIITSLLTFFGALLLFAAAIAWWKVVRFPDKGPEKGREELDRRRIETAARTTAIAFGLCAAAALLAVMRLFAG